MYKLELIGKSLWKNIQTKWFSASMVFQWTVGETTSTYY